MSNQNMGVTRQVMGPVVDVEFPVENFQKSTTPFELVTIQFQT
ncbi:MAG: hypothetical protein U0T83_05180 [Bacteriovoracaceae bacterium]